MGVCFMQSTLERYLYAIKKVKESYFYVRAVDLTHYLKVSRPSASAAVQKLLEKGWIIKEQNGNLKLTPTGEQYLEKLEERFDFFQKLLTDAGVDPAVAFADSVRFSWEMSDESYEAFQSAYSPPRTPDIGSERVQSHSFSP